MPNIHRSYTRSFTRSFCTLATCLALCTSWAPAQSGTIADPILPPTIGGVELESTATQIDAMNLSISLPKGSVSETTSFGQNATMGIGFPDQIGVMLIKEQKTTDPDLTINQVSENIIAQLVRFGSSRTGKIISREPKLTINQHQGERFYIRIPGSKGNPDTIRGMTIFKSRTQRFVIFDLTTTTDHFEQARAMYETSIASMDLGNPTNTDLKRAAAIKSMLAFLDTQTIEDYQRSLTKKKDHWERLFLPSPSGDEMDAKEFGYRRVRSWGGFKGELTDKPRNKWNDDDRSLGYFVQIDAMALEEHIRVDTKATFYMSEDSTEESWTIKMSLRSDSDQRTSTITGARSKNSMVILLEQSDVPPSKSHPLIQGEGYISQVQTYLMSSLLANNAPSGEYASYAYNSSQSAITLRWDTVERPEDSPGLTKVTTRTSSETPPTTTYYDANGDIMRTTLSNGRIWEPIELDRLLKLWKKKGLPLD